MSKQIDFTQLDWAGKDNLTLALQTGYSKAHIAAKRREFKPETTKRKGWRWKAIYSKK